MLMKFRTSIRFLGCALAVALLTSAGMAQSTQPTLKWGDPAPPLKVVKWLKGTPVERFEPGKVYVVEFWATWCGPCKAAMPHLSELAKKYEGKATFIGVDVWENGADPLPAVEAFVNGEVGKSMQYNVAADEPGRDGFMSVNWLKAAGANGIPATFVVADGKVVWTGHPDELAPVLEQVTSKTYDMAATLKATQERDAAHARINAAVQSVLNKVKAKDYAGAVAAAEMDDAKALTGRPLEFVQRARFTALLHLDEAKAREFGREVASTTANTLHMPRMMAIIIADTGAEEGVRLSKETYALGAQWLDGAFAKAPALAGNPEFDVARARCHFGAGDATKALNLITAAAQANGKSSSIDHVKRRAPVIDELARKYAAAAGVEAPAETTAAAQLAASERAAAEAAKPKPKIYDESADARQQIASALASAKQNNRRVLIEWGGNWCAWCLRLNELFAGNADVAKALKANYELVHVDAGKPVGKNMDLAASYGAELKKSGFPFLTVLDADGEVLANQPTGELEAGSIEMGHDPAKVLAFLSAHAAPGGGATAAMPTTAPANGATVQLNLIGSGAGKKLSGYVPMRAELVNEKPATITKLPDDVTAPIYGELPLAGREGAHYHVVFDAPKGQVARLFADTNGDGDLTNDPPAEWAMTRAAEGNKPALHSGAATFDLGTPDKPLQVRVNLYTMGDGYDTLFRHPDYATEGRLSLGGKEYPVMLSDPACTGDFSGVGIDPEDWTAVRPQLLIDVNGDGEFKGKGESVAVNEPFEVAGATYKLADVARDGTSFKVVRNEGEARQAAEKAPSPMRDAKTRRANAVGQPFELTFTDAISGRTIDVQKDLRGKVVVLDFWATWCGPCVKEMPHMKELYQQYKERGVEFIGVSLDNPEDKGGLTALKKYVSENEINWPQYHQYGKGGDKSFSSGWGVTSIPSIFVVDADGKLASTDARGKLETLIPELLAKRDRNAATR